MLNDDLSPALDLQSDLEKLEKYSGNVNWSYLQPHFESGVLLYVDPSLALTQVGLALAQDDETQVQAWISAGDLVQPCQLHATHWQESKEQFNAMIVRPFVLAQPIAAAHSAPAV